MLAVLALSVAACGGEGEGEGGGGTTPHAMNVLVVTLDTTRADYLGCYGGPLPTPELDAFAADAVRFSHCLAQSGATPPSHASIFTGLFPFQHGLRVIFAPSGFRLPAEVPYLPALLGAAGFATAACLSSFTVSDFFGFERGYDSFDSGLQRDSSEVLGEGRGGTYRWAVSAHQRRSDETTDAAVQWLRARPRQQPFLLWTHYWDPHDAEESVPSTYPPKEFLIDRVFRAEAAGLDRPRAFYAAEVAFVDGQFGRLLDELRAQGIYDDTVIVVVGDHGQGLGEHDWWAHRLLYQEQLHLPLLVRVPGWSRREDGVVPALVRAVDVLPTILDALGLPLPDDLEGASLRGLMAGEPQGEVRWGYAEALNRFDLNSPVAARRPRDGNLYCLTDGTWKLIYRPDDPDDSELYHLGDDVGEEHDLYAEDHPEGRRLRSVLDGWQPYRHEAFPAVGPAPTAADEAALRGLGYVGGKNDGK